MSGVWAAVQIGVGGVLSGSDPLGPADIDVDDVRDTACAVTSSSTVCQAPPEPRPLPEPDLSAPAAGGFGFFSQLLVILLVAALVAALAWMIWRFVSDRPVDDEEVDDGDLDDDEALDDVLGPRVVDDEQPPDRWRRRAAEHRDRGEYRDAVRCEYRALVGDLARAGYVDEIPGRTSGEERTQVAAIAPPGSGVPDRFDEAADRFDVAWFDDEPVVADDDAAFVAASTAVLDMVLTGNVLTGNVLTSTLTSTVFSGWGRSGRTSGGRAAGAVDGPQAGGDGSQ